MTTENGVKKQQKQRGRPFTKGVSGNPKGKPKGARSRTTLLLEKMMSEDGENVVRSVIRAAVEGDMQAAKLIIDRLVPVRRGRSIDLDLPDVKTTIDTANAHAEVLSAVSEGRLDTEQAEALMRLLGHTRESILAADLEQRIINLEKAKEV